MHIRELDGRRLTFGHRGWLWHNAYLLYDRGTDSIWHHQFGWAMAGPLRGRALRRLPTSLMTFDAWTSEHPETLVLPKPAPEAPEVQSDGYAQRNSVLSFGVGVDLEGAFRLYPYEQLRGSGAVEETVAGVPLVVALDPLAGSAFAWDRRVAGRVLSFVLEETPAGPELRERDGSRRWRLRSGRSVAGSAASEPLRAVLASQWEVAAWGFQHPRGTVFPEPPDGTTGVPAGGRGTRESVPR